jgi:hypothetical protein
MKFALRVYYRPRMAESDQDGLPSRPDSYRKKPTPLYNIQPAGVELLLVFFRFYVKNQPKLLAGVRLLSKLLPS